MTIRRNTIQKNLVRDAVYQLKGHVTADEVYEYVKKDHPSVGKGTVYRNLAILAEEEAVRKVEVPEGPDRYDFTLQDHYHVRCVKCGDVFDVDMEVLPDLMERIRDQHGMQYLGYDIFFKGICAACQKKQEGGSEWIEKQCIN